MFFKKLTKKTALKRKIELKYKFFFWNKCYGSIDAPITHKLDYIPEEWMVTGFSSLQASLVYDTQTFIEFSYNNPKQLVLKLQNMSFDQEQLFPSLTRNLDLIIREYTRIHLTHKNNNIPKIFKQHSIFIIDIPLHNIFLSTNLFFIQRSLLYYNYK